MPDTRDVVPVVVDTREQRPYAFDAGRVMVTRGMLAAGDYSLVGLEDRVAIERKSLDDFVSTVIFGRDRFRAELDLMSGYEFAAVVVEANVDDMLEGRYTSKASPQSLFAIMCSIIADRGISVFFLSDRQTAQAAVEQLLVRLYRKMTTPISDSHQGE